MTPRQLTIALGVAGGVAYVLALVLTALGARIAARIGFVDHPGGHKSHRLPTPYGGGSALFASSWLPIAFGLLLVCVVPGEWIAARFGDTSRVYAGGVALRVVPALIILLGAVCVHVLGLIDDVRPQGATLKLVAVLVVALVVTTFGRVRIGQALLGDGGAIALTTVWFVVVINAFNFLDNMDGLSAGVAWICIAFLTICGLMAGQVIVPALGCVFLGAIGGFLVFNFPPARIFMGDAGSLVLGYNIAVLSVLTTYFESGRTGAEPYALAMPLVILAVPLYDFASVMVIRLAEGRNPMKGDQRHFSHRLVDHGLSRRFAVLTIYLATATTGLAATLLPGASLRTTITVALIVLMVLSIVAILEAPPRRET
jgi:UDP-GlcNAc:undecaprenyl-phosphate GlcNAc-1-phosphate transferase